MAGLRSGSIPMRPDFPPPRSRAPFEIGQMQIGETRISLHDKEDPIFGIDVVPFLATSYEEARKLWAASQPTIARNFAAQGLMVLFAVPWPPQGIFANQEINQIGDLKGLSWRVYNRRHPAHRADRQCPSCHDPGGRSTARTCHRLDQRSHDFSRDWLRRQGVGQDGLFLRHPGLDPEERHPGEQGAFDQLDKPMQDAVLKVAAAAEARGWWFAGQGQVVHGAACRSRHEGIATERGLEDGLRRSATALPRSGS